MKFAANANYFCIEAIGRASVSRQMLLLPDVARWAEEMLEIGNFVSMVSLEDWGEELV